MALLKFHEAGRPLFDYILRDGRTVIGRSDACDLALPSDSVSRVHCLIDHRPEGWVLQDRSRNGTLVNGQPADNQVLMEGDEITLGTYRTRFTGESHLPSKATTSTPLAMAFHAELVQATEERIVSCRAELKLIRGPRAGLTWILEKPLWTLGGPGSDVELDEKLPAKAASLKVIRSRAMVGPGTAPVFLAGQRVWDFTPILPGEEVRVGEHGLVVNPSTAEERVREKAEFGELVAASGPMKHLFGVLWRVSAHDAPVLLCGESGTGKELAARALHEAGPRFEKPFVALNCAAIAETLFESELFGHEKGAFTGATARADGAFQRAEGGTLFLDEIGELQLELQAKLLRALESGEVRRVGGAAPEFPDVRLISATNRNLPEMVRKGMFREDLYFRLAVLTIRVPSLRERIDDIPIIAEALLRRHHPGATLTPEAMDELQRYEWPGNVRELRNVLTRAVVMYGSAIGPTHLSFHPWSFDDQSRAPLAGPTSLLRPRANDDPERSLLTTALEQAEGNRTRAAQILGIPRSSLLYKLNKHGLLER
jgi:DNA-binding NtrC family response regulator